MKTQPHLALGSAILLAGFIGFTTDANAAMLTAPPTGEINLNGDVDILFIDETGNGPTPDDSFNFDFVPPGTGFGDLASLSATSCSGSFLAFCAGSSAASPAVHITKDALSVPAGGGPFAIEDFITLVNPGDPMDADDFFHLTEVGVPLFTPSDVGGQPSTAVSISVSGMWESEDGTLYNGIGTYTTQFVGLTPDQAFEELTSGTTVSKSISANFNISAKVPEPGVVCSLTIALGSAFIGLKRKAKI